MQIKFRSVEHHSSIVQAGARLFTILGNSWLFLADGRKVAFQRPKPAESFAGKWRSAGNLVFPGQDLLRFGVGGSFGSTEEAVHRDEFHFSPTASVASRTEHLKFEVVV